MTMLVIAPLLSCVAADGIQDLSLTDANQMLSNLITDEYAEMQPMENQANKLQGTEFLFGFSKFGCQFSSAKIKLLGGCEAFMDQKSLCKQHPKALSCCEDELTRKRSFPICGGVLQWKRVPYFTRQHILKKLRKSLEMDIYDTMTESLASGNQVPMSQGTELFSLLPCAATKARSLGVLGSCEQFYTRRSLCKRYPNALSCCEDELRRKEMYPMCSAVLMWKNLPYRIERRIRRGLIFSQMNDMVSEA